jgi:hypothetical protein
LSILDAPFDITEDKYKNTKLYGLRIGCQNSTGWFAWEGITLLKVNNEQKIYRKVGVWKMGVFIHGHRQRRATEFEVNHHHSIL